MSGSRRRARERAIAFRAEQDRLAGIRAEEQRIQRDTVAEASESQRLADLGSEDAPAAQDVNMGLVQRQPEPARPQRPRSQLEQPAPSTNNVVRPSPTNVPVPGQPIVASDKKGKKGVRPSDDELRKFLDAIGRKRTKA